MTECWSEGALRAYLDRELPTEDMQRVAAHLGECKVCDGLCTELAARAAHVSALLELLPEWSAAMPRPADGGETAAALDRHRRGAGGRPGSCCLPAGGSHSKGSDRPSHTRTRGPHRRRLPPPRWK